MRGRLVVVMFRKAAHDGFEVVSVEVAGKIEEIHLDDTLGRLR